MLHLFFDIIMLRQNKKGNRILVKHGKKDTDKLSKIVEPPIDTHFTKTVLSICTNYTVGHYFNALPFAWPSSVSIMFCHF